MSQGGVGGKKLRHLKKMLHCFFFMVNPSKDIMLDISHPYDMGLDECHTWDNGSV